MKKYNIDISHPDALVLGAIVAIKGAKGPDIDMFWGRS